MGGTFGRVVVDARGIRQRPFLFLFGPRFDLAWGEVTGWAVTEGEVRAAGVGAVTVRVLELHTRSGMHSVQRVGTDPDFGRLVQAVAARLPKRKTASRLARAHPGRSNSVHPRFPLFVPMAPPPHANHKTARYFSPRNLLFTANFRNAPPRTSVHPHSL